MTTEPTHVLLIPCDTDSNIDDLLQLRERLPDWVEVTFILGARGSMMMIPKANNTPIVVNSSRHFSLVDAPQGQPSKLVKGVDY